MPELENLETKQTDQASAILAGYLNPKELARALDVSERTIARWPTRPVSDSQRELPIDQFVSSRDFRLRAL